MKVEEIYNLAIEKGMEADFRGKEGVNRFLDSKKKKYESLPDEQKADFDKEIFKIPYMDSQI